MAATHDKERELTREISQQVETSVPGTEVLAVELLGPDRICVFIDHPQGVDHALCERVTGVLDPFRRTYGIDVSSPGSERPRGSSRAIGAASRPAAIAFRIASPRRRTVEG